MRLHERFSNNSVDSENSRRLRQIHGVMRDHRIVVYGELICGVRSSFATTSLPEDIKDTNTASIGRYTTEVALNDGLIT